MYGAMDISVSGMVAQRTRLETIASNIANSGTPKYRAREVFFTPGDPSSSSAAGRRLGVHVSEIQQSKRPLSPVRHDPTDPNAEQEGPYKGWVMGSNVNTTLEQLNAIRATRSYEANVIVAEATKVMISQGLRLIA